MVDSEQNNNKNRSSETLVHKMNFSTFILSLNSSVLINLGLIEDPFLKKKDKNLILAKQSIDIIDMLFEKTKGNLTKEEDSFIKNILFELRMLYVKEKN
ncbi:MAG: DUF1844 domain-containing protein [Desulfobacterales bacterium]|nr:DUF1844 domain-containing protein [Desulfobacterales bacterium]